MQMKTLFLALCVALALLAGCGRSKPQSSKTAEADTSALENVATPTPPDQLPPKSTAAPVPAPVTASARPGAPVFGPLPPGRDRAGDAMRQKYQEGAVKILQNTKGQELERKRLEALQNQPQGDSGSNQ